MASDQHFFTPPKDKRLFIIVGAFGSGKTEFAINLALFLTAQGRQTALADLDLVNPYFRSREKDGLLESHEIRLIAPKGELRHTDLPSVPPALRQLIYDGAVAGVLDIGGDRTGARVLGAFTADIQRQDPAVWYVFNCSRYDNADKDAALDSLRQIEDACGLKVNGIVNNTHLLHDTQAKTVFEGAETARRFAGLAELPLICHCAGQHLTNELGLLSPLFPLRFYMNRPWEDG